MPTQCHHPACARQSSFNHPGEQKAKFCSEHKEPGMESVRKHCEYPSCTRLPSFNYPGEKNRRYCKNHKEPGMESVANKRCEHESCTKEPSFNHPGEKAGRFCKTHSEIGMESVLYKRCEHESCTKRPSFNFPGEQAAKFCNEHKLPGMENVKRNICEHSDCTKTSTYGRPGERPVRCMEHRMPDMKNIACCKYPDCMTVASYGYNGSRIRCSKHKSEDMEYINLCRSDFCNISVTHKKYDGYCAACFIHLFPENKVSRNYKTKENEVATFVKSLEIDKEYLTTFDRRLEYGCSLRRPDIMIECVTHVVVVEVDENQHSSIDCACEEKRHMQIFQDVGGNRPIVFIRFNPDGYKDSHGTKHPSCFKFHKQLCIPIINDRHVWSARLEVLKARIIHHISKLPCSEVIIEHLFYNGFH